MVVSLSTVGGASAQFFDNNGVILSGGQLYAYAAGTTASQATYTSSSGSIAHTNPIILDSAGRVPGGEIWLASGISYKFAIKDKNYVPIATWDNITGINDFSSLTPVIYNAVGDGSSVVFSLSGSPSSENTTQVYIGGVYQQKNTYSVVNTLLTFSQAPPTNSAIEVSYS